MSSYNLESAVADFVGVRDVGALKGQTVVLRYVDGRSTGVWISDANSLPSRGEKPAQVTLALDNGATILIVGKNHDCKAIYRETEKRGCWQEFPSIEVGNARHVLRTLNSERACIFDRVMPPAPVVWVLDNKARPELSNGLATCFSFLRYLKLLSGKPPRDLKEQLKDKKVRGRVQARFERLLCDRDFMEKFTKDTGLALPQNLSVGSWAKHLVKMVHEGY